MRLNEIVNSNSVFACRTLGNNVTIKSFINL